MLCKDTKQVFDSTPIASKRNAVILYLPFIKKDTWILFIPQVKEIYTQFHISYFVRTFCENFFVKHSPHIPVIMVIYFNIET